MATQWLPADTEPLSVGAFFGAWFSRSGYHRPVREQLRRPYSESCVAGLEADFERVADDLLEALPPAGDLLREYFVPFGIYSTLQMFELPESQWSNLSRVVAIVSDFIKKPLEGEAVSTRDVKQVERCIGYLRAVLDARMREDSTGLVLAALRGVAERSPGGRWLAVATFAQLLSAGVEPMTMGAALACRELFLQPDLLERIRAGTLAVDRVVEEALRLNPPFPVLHRWVQQPCDHLGPSLAPGTFVGIDVRRVNRDPEVMSEPDAFRPDRPRAANLTFGRGRHTCLGINSARLQMAVALRRLFALRPGLVVRAEGADVVDRGYATAVAALPYFHTAFN